MFRLIAIGAVVIVVSFIWWAVAQLRKPDNSSTNSNTNTNV